MQNDSLAIDNQVSNKPRGRWVLILMFLFFALPLLLVVAMHKYDWHPQGGKSHGELIAPARPLQMPPQLLDAHGIALRPELWHDKWSMVYIANDCQQACHSSGLRAIPCALSNCGGISSRRAGVMSSP